MYNGEEICGGFGYYDADEVDAAIAELKRKLEDAQASAYAESVDAGMRERRLKRALWLARANRALEKIAWFKLWNASISTMNPEDGARQEYDKWKKNLGKFLSKAEQYK
jgi:O-methyltransferase involved in polyketide biosynthesis